jgi:hypothetical protein
MWLRRQFLCNMRPFQIARLLLLLVVYFSPHSFCNISSFHTWSVLLIFSIPLQHHMSTLSRYYWPTFRSVQVLAQHTALMQMFNSTSFFLKCKSNLLVTSLLRLVECYFCHDNLGFNFSVCFKVTKLCQTLKPFVELPKNTKSQHCKFHLLH